MKFIVNINNISIITSMKLVRKVWLLKLGHKKKIHHHYKMVFPRLQEILTKTNEQLI